MVWYDISILQKKSRIHNIFFPYFTIQNIPSKPCSLLFGEMMGISFDEFFAGLFINFSLQQLNNFFVANALHGLQICSIAFIEQSLYFFYESFVEHFMNSFIYSPIRIIFLSSESEHENWSFGCLLDKTFRLRFS